MPPGAVKVTRPGIWGNPFVVSEKVRPGAGVGGSYIAMPTAADAVACFREMLQLPAEPGQRAYEMRQRLPELRGKDLGCWCRLCARHAAGKPIGEPCPDCAPCHADPLGEAANA